MLIFVRLYDVCLFVFLWIARQTWKLLRSDIKQSMAATTTVTLFNIACSRHSDSGARAKTKASERAGKTEGRLGERTRERLWNFLKGSRSGIPESGIPSDWPNLTPPVNTRGLLTQTRNVIWRTRSKVILHRVTNGLISVYGKRLTI